VEVAPLIAKSHQALVHRKAPPALLAPDAVLVLILGDWPTMEVTRCTLTGTHARRRPSAIGRGAGARDRPQERQKPTAGWAVNAIELLPLLRPSVLLTLTCPSRRAAIHLDLQAIAHKAAGGISFCA